MGSEKKKLHRICIDDAGSYIDVMPSANGAVIMCIVDYEKQGDEPAQEMGSRFIYMFKETSEALIKALDAEDKA